MTLDPPIILEVVALAAVFRTCRKPIRRGVNRARIALALRRGAHRAGCVPNTLEVGPDLRGPGPNAPYRFLGLTVRDGEAPGLSVLAMPRGPQPRYGFKQPRRFEEPTPTTQPFTGEPT